MMDIKAQPFNNSFDPNPHIDSSHITCQFTTVGADITIAHNGVRNSSFQFFNNVVSTLSASANRHLQSFERKKFLQHDKPHSSLGHIINRDSIIQELINKNMVAVHFAIDPLG
jgi:hypothetical protein